MTALFPLFSYVGYDPAGRTAVRGVVGAKDFKDARRIVRERYEDILGSKEVNVQRYRPYGDVLLESAQEVTDVRA